MKAAPVFKITPTIQEYDWGKPGLSSKVAQFATAAGLAGFSVKESTPYAELWMGTHTKSPSLVSSTSEPLGAYLSKNPSFIGEAVAHKFHVTDGNLPFLFKVLAIQKALSIQSHPDLATAKVLHADHPDIYKDPNHKPEMALALTPFTALCGFLPLPIIAKYLSVTPEFAALVPTAIAERFTSLSTSSTPTGLEEKQALKDVFSAVMTADEAEFKAQLTKLVDRYAAGKVHEEELSVKELVLRVNEQFPGDIGTFCVFLLNYVQLQPGEAVFLGAGEPHAYISGDIMECMANSDNVIRAGLTPKLRDIPNLVSTLTYAAAPPTKHKVQPSPFRGTAHSTLYDPPIPEFSVLQVVVPAGEKERHPPIQGPSIAIVTEGSGQVSWGLSGDNLDLGEGTVVFVGADVEVEFTAGDAKFVVHRAFVEA
ncbi:mannose-6-phosphate isomerase [Artomyces pyxidatus]|uniref:Mannose-6-phosphate isomerase n=1 Tax=Artomyces pyxidatus TaxID=48021 RepID=A0ACB8SNC1_9AGAM|nr:mannose-6-phosphate isomerase [Artomyces pyxidatus]